MANSQPQWTWDTCAAYRLTTEVVENYMKEKFGNYKTFRTQVRNSAQGTEAQLIKS